LKKRDNLRKKERKRENIKKSFNVLTYQTIFINNIMYKTSK